jgi:hypothetical protein
LRVAHRLHNDRLVRVVALLLAVMAPACFYVDPINQRPSGQIVRVDPATPMRGGGTTVAAQWSDPDGDAVTFAWAVAACAADGVTCDAVPFLTGTSEEFPISPIPYVLGNQMPVAKLSITVEVIDTHGAEARPVPALLLDIGDAAPTVMLQDDGRQWNHMFPVPLPITVRALKADVDDLDPAAITLTWDQPYAPGSDPTKVSWTTIPDPAHPNVETRQFTPDVPGSWNIHVTATDPEGQSSDENLPIPVAADQPPCLGATDPILTTGTIVVDQARRFSVLTVDDDIDIYPAPPAGSLLGTAGFSWSLASPASSGALVPLATDDSGVVIDPADYAPGDQLDLRVEVTDRVARTLPCDPSTPQCSIGGVTTCLQRQTWHVEIR